MKKLQKNKKALEVSVNFLVVVIFAIVTLSLGFVFLNKIFLKAGEIPGEINKITEAELERLLSSGERTAIAFDTKTVPRGKSDVFGLGILNVASNNDEKCFYITTQVSTAVGQGGTTPIANPGGKINVVWIERPYVIENKKSEKISIMIETKKGKIYPESGTYAINVNVFRGKVSGSYCPNTNPAAEIYGNPLKIYVNVP